MTKKELLENKWFKDAPDDTPIVFKTCEFLAACNPLRKKDIWFMSQVTNADGIIFYKPMFLDANDSKCPKPIELQAIVINAMPYDILENYYHIKLE